MNATPNAKRIHAAMAREWSDLIDGYVPLSPRAISWITGIPLPSVRRALYEHSAFRRDKTRPWLFLARDVSPAESAVGLREIRWTAPPVSYLQRLRCLGARRIEPERVWRLGNGSTIKFDPEEAGASAFQGASTDEHMWWW